MNPKRFLKAGAGKIAESWLLRSVVARSALKSINVVYYHFVGDPPPYYKAFYSGCTIEKFEDDLRRLHAFFDFGTLDEVIASPRRDKINGKPLLALTFDDGFDLTKAGLLDILNRYGIKATTFVVTSCIGNRTMMWRHKLSAIQTLAPGDVWRREYTALSARYGFPALGQGDDLMKNSKAWNMHQKDAWTAILWERCGLPEISTYLRDSRPYFDIDGLRRWISAGHKVGLHTHTHPFCSRLTEQDLEDEFIRPARQLEMDLGLETVPVSYPFGDRLSVGLEDRLTKIGIFSGFFGIRGFARRSSPKATLERANIEGNSVGWAVFAVHAFRSQT